MKRIHYVRGVSAQSAAAPIDRQLVESGKSLIGKDVLEIEQETQIKNSSSESRRPAIALE